jgi:glycosyltransferase involved in cell wall biosynthesis
MKIVFVSDAVYPYNKGGKEKRLFEISTRLAAMGNDVHIYCMKWWDGPKTRTENGVRLHAISKLYPLYSGERRSIKQGVLFGLACVKLIREDFDVIDVDHMPFFPLYSVWLVCLLKRKKMFATWNEVWGRKYWVEYMGVAGNISALIERISVLLPAKITAISPHTSVQLREQLHCKKELAVVSCGLDYSQIKKVKPSAHKSDVIFTGRLLKNKRVDLLVRAVAELQKSSKPIKCIIVGDGPEKASLQQLARKLNMQSVIEFHDFYEDHNKVYALIKASKVFAHPSEREGFGIVAIEANACGKPVVTNLATANATKDLIKDNYNGFRFAKTAKALASSIEVALQTSDTLENNCLARAKQFDWKALSYQLAEVYAS